MFGLPIEEECDPADWTDAVPSNLLGTNLAKFEECLLCSICRSHFDNPHMLLCGHSFCSLCIRNHLDPKKNTSASKDKCPSCRAGGVDVVHIKPNRSLATQRRNINDISLRLWRFKTITIEISRFESSAS